MTLFGVMINDIERVLSPAIGRVLFVDDFAVWCSAASTQSMERQLQVAVSRVEAWGKPNGFRFSTTKTVDMQFSRKRRPTAPMVVSLTHGPTW